MGSAAQRASEDDKQKLIDRVDAFIFDCDGMVVDTDFCSSITMQLTLILVEGVIWRGDSLIEGIPETLDMLKSLVCDLCSLLS